MNRLLMYGVMYSALVGITLTWARILSGLIAAYLDMKEGE